MGAVFQSEQFADFVQAKAQALGRFHKPHPRHIRFAIATNAAIGFIRLRQQALALVKTDGLHIDPGGVGESADSQIPQRVLHSV